MRNLAAIVAALLLMPGTAAATTPSPEPTGSPAPVLGWELVSRRPHDAEAFTQGLVIDEDGRLFESTGRYGESTVREVDSDSGAVLRRRAQPVEQFGEGLALVGDGLIQLTWKAGLARRYAKEDFVVLERYRYDGEGWGLCYDGERLVMSDGSDRLDFRDVQTFAVLESVNVTWAGEPVARLNELECVDGSVWSNVLGLDALVRIDPASGIVDGVLDLRELRELLDLEGSPGSLNGIAYDALADTYLVTGKDWPELFEIRIVE